MAGIRIVHETKRSCVLTIVDATRPYKQPYECPTCHATHRFKSYHVPVDDQGAAIVSPEVLERIKRLPLHGFAIQNEVRKPPSIRIGWNGVGDLPPIEPHATLKEPT
jgi:hypothetical protein